jgi:hypothetical protein
MGISADEGIKYEPILSVVREILTLIKAPLEYRELLQLFYLIHRKYAEKYGRRLTKAYFVCPDKDPYCTDLHIRKLRKWRPEILVAKKGETYTVRLSPHLAIAGKNDLDEDNRAFIAEVVEGCKHQPKVKTVCT